MPPIGTPESGWRMSSALRPAPATLDLLTRAVVEALRQRGLLVQVYSGDQMARINPLAEWGVIGISTKKLQRHNRAVCGRLSDAALGDSVRPPRARPRTRRWPLVTVYALTLGDAALGLATVGHRPCAYRTLPALRETLG